jgi:predicted site-specific integrase-resolvase
MAKREPKLLRLSVAAHELGLHPITVRRWIKAGRRHLQRLLKLVCEDRVGEVAITYEDRLTRFGQEYLETLFACFDVTLTVLEPGEEKTPEQELTTDLLALIASFSGRLYGLRSHKQQALVACARQVIADQEE